MPNHAPQSSDGAVFDRPSALGRLGGDEQLFRELAAYFHEDSAAEIERLEQGIAQEDWEAIQRAAHSLKGLSANFSAYATTEVARETEKAATESNLERVKSLLEPLRTSVERLKDALLEAAG